MDIRGGSRLLKQEGHNQINFVIVDVGLAREVWGHAPRKF